MMSTFTQFTPKNKKTFLSFTSEALLNEAKVSAKRVDKAVEIFVRLLERKLGTKMYQFGGKGGITQIKGGIGFLFFYDMNKAIRFNYISGDITSITLWKQYKLGKKGDKTISFEGIGLTAAGKKLLEILTGEEKDINGEYYFLPESCVGEVNNDSEILSESKRISLADAAAEVALVYNEKDMSQLSFSQILAVLEASGYSFPTKLEAYASSPGRGKKKYYDLTPLLKDGAGSENKIRSIKVLSGDSNTTKEVVVGGNQRAKEMEVATKQIINDPTPEQIEEMRKKVDSQFGIMANLVQVIARKVKNSLLIYGGPGTGKTYVVNQTLKEEGLKKNKDFFIVKGKISTAELYRTLYMHRQNNKVIVFDDTDSLWFDKDASNLAKAALDSYAERTVSWFTRATFNVSVLDDDERQAYYDELDAEIGDPESRMKYPSEFPFEGRVIFISNLAYEKFDSAVLTRSMKIDMTLTEQEMFVRMESILEHLGSSNIPLSAKKEILEFLKTANKTGKMSGISMRTYVSAEEFYQSGLPNWKELLAFG